MLAPSTTPVPELVPDIRPRLRRTHFLRELLETLALIVVVYTLFNLATVRFYIEGPSMQPNFWAGQYLVVSRVHYMFSDPQRGEVVVFDPPGDSDPDLLLIKRLIGMPGDTVELRGGQVFINGVQLAEPYINETECRARCDGVWTLDENNYFFMGDNRNDSRDSRVFGEVSRDRIIGEVVLRYFPIPDFSFVAGHQYPVAVQ
jgi:signal peptidase I